MSAAVDEVAQTELTRADNALGVALSEVGAEDHAAVVDVLANISAEHLERKKGGRISVDV